MMKFFRPRLFLLLSLSTTSFIFLKANDQLAKQMLSHVEKIVVIDSIAVDRDGFYKNYKIQPSTGRILSGKEISSSLKDTKLTSDFTGNPYTGFTNEFNDYLIWAQEDTTGFLRLAESYRLIDDSWTSPKFTSPILNFGEELDEGIFTVEANTAFPFMDDDGQTLYFASDNENSLGGYDIFVATKDPADGDFMVPVNLGMPFNSPYDDYMMVLDRQTGVGWWATDRNQLEDKVTVYIYTLSDSRVNVDPDDEDLQVYATLNGWESIQDEETLDEVKKLRERIADIKPVDNRQPEFELPMPSGKIYRNFSDFKNKNAASLMQSYVRDNSSLDKKRERLASLRIKYEKTKDANTVSDILRLEQEIRTEENSIKALLSEIYKAEK